LGTKHWKEDLAIKFHSIRGRTISKREITIKMEIQQLSNRSGREKKMGLSAESLAAALSYTLLASSGKQKLRLATTKLFIEHRHRSPHRV